MGPCARGRRGKKMFTLLGPKSMPRVADMVAEKNCLHFWGQIATKVTKHVAEPILAPESRFRGIRWGNLHHFSKSIRSDWSRGAAAAAGSFDTVMITGAKFDANMFPLHYSLGPLQELIM